MKYFSTSFSYFFFIFTAKQIFSKLFWQIEQILFCLKTITYI